ncbi:SOS response-associated peptidase family protein [Parerythrobacter aurantius]|uniref:SOS response-associated peptidase n=1 Tax=Parerythrobacter aurantius TaxID=3127706 RepID=UPI003254AF8D
MCNLYKVKSSHTEVADFFDAIAEDFGANTPEEFYPGYPTIAVAEGRVRSMVWGFPLAQTGAKGQPLKPKPVNNTRTDKVKSFFWRDSFENRRCLIPVSTFAEAEGPKGRMTRTWFTMPETPLFATAGIWRKTDEWGAACSMLMTEANAQVAPVHNRMPVILPRESWDRWLGGTPSEAYDLCIPFQGELSIDRTDEPWFRRRGG